MQEEDRAAGPAGAVQSCSVCLGVGRVYVPIGALAVGVVNPQMYSPPQIPGVLI